MTAANTASRYSQKPVKIASAASNVPLTSTKMNGGSVFHYSFNSERFPLTLAANEMNIPMTIWLNSIILLT